MSGTKRRKYKRQPYRDAFERANNRMQEETAEQCSRLYGAACIALHRHWNKKQLSLTRLFQLVHETWIACANDNTVSMIQMCEEETGIELMNEDGKHWKDLAFLNYSIDMDPAKMTNAQWVVMRNNQIRWVRPQVMACLLIALNKKYRFGFERCGKIYAQIEEIEREYGCKPYRLRDACLNETGMDIRKVIMEGAGA